MTGGSEISTVTYTKYGQKPIVGGQVIEKGEPFVYTGEYKKQLVNGFRL